MADGRLVKRVRALARKVIRTTYRTGLIGFGRLPHPIQRWIVRIASPSYTVGALLVLDHQGSVLVLRQLHREGWTLPGGLLSHGEAPAVGVVREAGEELGLTVDLAPDALPTATLVEPHYQRVDVIFRVEVATRPKVRPRGEALEAAWLTYDELTAGGPADGRDEATVQVLELTRRAIGR